MIFDLKKIMKFLKIDEKKTIPQLIFFREILLRGDRVSVLKNIYFSNQDKHKKKFVHCYCPRVLQSINDKNVRIHSTDAHKKNVVSLFLMNNSIIFVFFFISH